MALDETRTRDELISELERWQDQCLKLSGAYLNAVARCRNRDPGNDTVQNLKVATILQEIAFQKYQRTIDSISDRLHLDKPFAKP